MNDLLNEMERLLAEMHEALIHNQATKVSELAALQDTCMRKIQQYCSNNKEALKQHRDRLQSLQEKLQLNHVLIENAVKLTNGIIQERLQQNRISCSGNA